MPWQLLRISRQSVYANSIVCDMQYQMEISTTNQRVVLILQYSRGKWYSVFAYISFSYSLLMISPIV